MEKGIPAVSATVPEIRSEDLLRYTVIGSRRPSVYFWAVVLTAGGLGFTLAGLSSYFHRNLLPFSDPASLVFIPQGIAMLFYGVLGFLAGLYQWLSLYWNLGGRLQRVQPPYPKDNAGAAGLSGQKPRSSSGV